MDMTPQLHLGDCLEVLPTLPDASVDLVLADLPYAHMVAGKLRKCTANKWDTPIDLAALWVQLRRVGKERCAFIFTATQPFATALINSWHKGFRYDLIWEKNKATCHVHCKRFPLRAHESVIVFGSGGLIYNPQKTPGKPYDNYNRKAQKEKTYSSVGKRRNGNKDGTRYPRSVLRFRHSHNVHHPSQKPVALMEWIVRTYSNPGDTVLDPTMGSATTGVACLNTDRKFIGIEKDATYFSISQQRIAKGPQPKVPSRPLAKVLPIKRAPNQLALSFDPVGPHDLQASHR